MENTKKGFDFNALDNGTKIIMGLSIAGIVGCFLPYVTVGPVSLTIMDKLTNAHYLGYLILAAFALSALTPIIGEQLNNISGALGRFGPRGSVAAALIGLILKAVIDKTSEIGEYISFGIGFYLMIAAAVIIILIQQKIIKIK